MDKLKYIEVDSEGKVIYINNFPFDDEHGLGKTEAELLDSGYLVEEIPQIKYEDGFSHTLYFDGEEFEIIRKEIKESKKIEELQSDVETLSDALNEFMELTLGGDL